MKNDERNRHPSSDGFVTLLAGPAVWFLFFLAAYTVTGAGCQLFAVENGAGLSILRVIVVSLAIAATAVIAIAGIRAGMRYRRRREDDSEAYERSAFMDLAGVSLAAASVVGVIWLTAGVLIHPLC